MAAAGVVGCLGRELLLLGQAVEATGVGRGARPDQSRCRAFLERRQRERQAYVHRQQFPTRYDKAVRAQSIIGRMALEGLYVPTQAPWYSAFRSELLSFPAGKHDDMVDALGLVGQLLDQMVKGRAPDLNK